MTYDATKLREIYEAATPGRWEALDLDGDGTRWTVEVANALALVAQTGPGLRRDADARLIAAMHDAIPELLADVDRLTRERDELLTDWKEVDALPAVRAAFEPGMKLVDAVSTALADIHYAEGTPLFDAEIAKREAEEERNEANARADAAETALGNLLAILHRDGGHRLAEVGAEQAVREAHERWAEVVRRADAAEAARASLAAELAALRAAAHEAMRATSKQYSAARRALVTALADTRAAAEAHDAEVRREALREAAAMLDPVDGNSLECEDREDVPGWLRALASRERGQ